MIVRNQPSGPRPADVAPALWDRNLALSTDGWHQRQARAVEHTGGPDREGPGSWSRLADDLFRMAHHDRTGRLLLHPKVVGVGLAAALLGELALAGRITVDGASLIVIDSSVPVDALAHSVLDQVIGEPALPVSTWLVYLAQNSESLVAQRLRRAGHVRIESPRHLFARSIAYVPTDKHEAAGPTVRLSVGLRQGRPLSPFDFVLAALMVATGLDRPVLDGAPPFVGRWLRTAIAASEWPAVRLARHAETVIGEAARTSAH